MAMCPWAQMPSVEANYIYILILVDRERTHVGGRRPRVRRLSNNLCGI
jgi:hypothetical protein